MTNPNAGSNDRVDAADMRVKLPPVWVEPVKGKQKRKGSGKRSATRTDERQGRYVRAEIPHSKSSDIAFDATLRAAAPYQKWRESNGCALVIKEEDLRHGRPGTDENRKRRHPENFTGSLSET